MASKHQVIHFDADEFEKVATTPDKRIGQFTFKDSYGSTITLQMSDDFAAHFVATCQKIFVGDQHTAAGRLATLLTRYRTSRRSGPPSWVTGRSEPG